MLREASIARNLVDLLPLVKEYGPEHICFCTDDREPNFIVEEGHINQMVRVAVANGIRPEDALTMATHNAALQHGLHRLGAIAPGYQADLLLFDELTVREEGLTIQHPGLPEREFVRAPLRELRPDILGS